MGNGKYFLGIFLILLSIGIYFGGRAVLDVSCTGFNIINPLCWVGRVIDIGMEIIALWVAISVAFTGILVMFVSESQIKWLIGFMLFSTLLIIDLVIPDPIPLADELILGLGTMLFGLKALIPSKSEVGKKLPQF